MLKKESRETVNKSRVLLTALMAGFVSSMYSAADKSKEADVFWKNDLVWETDKSPKRVWAVDKKGKEEKDKKKGKEDKKKDVAVGENRSPGAPTSEELLTQIYSHKDLANKKFAVDVKGPATKVQEIIGLIGKSAGINFVIDPNVTGTFSQLSLTDVTPGQALQYILENNTPRLALVNSFGVWRIMKYSDAKTLMQLNEQDVYAVFDIRHALMDENFDKLVMEGWQKIAGSTAGSGFIMIDDARKQVFVRNDKYIIERFGEFLKSVDRVIDQVRVDIILVSVTKNSGCALGINYSGIYNRSQTIKDNNQNFGFAGMGGRMDNFGFPSDKVGQAVATAFDPTLNAFNLFTRAINNTVGFLAIPFVFGGPDLNTRRLNAVLIAAENENKLKILSRPSLLICNREAGKLAVGKNIPITTRSTEGIGSSSRSDSKVDYREIGVKVEIRPVINPEEDTVELDLYIEQSDIVAGNTLVNEFGVMENPPQIGNNRTKTNLILKNGQTTVIGGLKEHRSETERNRVPLLWRLPLVGNLFKASYQATIETEQYFFVTATIVEK
jgi:type IV pilus assembly protein PilQ